MNRMLAVLIAGAFAVTSATAFGQSASPSPGQQLKEDVKKAQDSPKGKKFEAQQQQLQDLSRNSPNPSDQKANVDKSKMQPREKSKYDEKAAQAASSNSATDPAQAKANVAASKAQGPRQKIDISKLSKEEKQELLRQLQKESTP